MDPLRTLVVRAGHLVMLPVALAVVKLPVLAGYRGRLLASGVKGERRGLAAEMLYTPVHYLWLRLDYWRESDPDRRTEKAMLAMGGTAGVDLAKNYTEAGLDFSMTVGNMTLWDANPTYAVLKRILSTGPENCTVIQLGSSSGREIAWVAGEFPGVSCVGTDLVPEVIQYSRATYNLPNLEFATVSARDLPSFAQRFADGPVLVFASGSMQQVQPEHVDLFFQGLGALDGVEVVFTESASTNDGNPLEFEGSKPREWFDYSHNYRWYGERHGFETVEARLIRPYESDDELHGTTAHYFFWGRRGAPIAPGAEPPGAKP